jgi:hypothetical protein
MTVRKYLSSKNPTNWLKKSWPIVFFLLVFALSTLMMTRFSGVIWRVILVEKLVQFPWRLLSLTTLSSAFLVGRLLVLVRNKFRPLVTVVFIGIVIGLNFGYLKPEKFVERDEGFYSTNEATTNVKDEYLPIWVKIPPKSRAEERVEIVSGQGEISQLVYNSKKTQFSLTVADEAEAQINTVYFPGWQVWINGQKTSVAYQNQAGLIRFSVGPGQHRALAQFGETPLRLAADIVSILGLVFVVGLLIRSRSQKLFKKGKN